MDGDALKLKGISLRLFDIDASEIDHIFGKNAKWALVGSCKSHTVQAKVVERDEYGPKTAKCTLPDGCDLWTETVKLGQMFDWPKFSDGK